MLQSGDASKKLLLGSVTPKKMAAQQKLILDLHYIIIQSATIMCPAFSS